MSVCSSAISFSKATAPALSRDAITDVALRLVTTAPPPTVPPWIITIAPLRATGAAQSLRPPMFFWLPPSVRVPAVTSSSTGAVVCTPNAPVRVNAPEPVFTTRAPGPPDAAVTAPEKDTSAAVEIVAPSEPATMGLAMAVTAASSVANTPPLSVTDLVPSAPAAPTTSLPAFTMAPPVRLFDAVSTRSPAPDLESVVPVNPLPPMVSTPVVWLTVIVPAATLPATVTLPGTANATLSLAANDAADPPADQGVLAGSVSQVPAPPTPTQARSRARPPVIVPSMEKSSVLVREMPRRPPVPL